MLNMVIFSLGICFVYVIMIFLTAPKREDLE